VCPGVDLSGVDLSHLDLDYADLDHANLRGATAPSTWQHGDIEYADLTGATGIGWLYSMDAAHVILPGQSLEVIQGDFTGADLDHLAVVFDGGMSGTFDGADLEDMGGCCTMTGSFRGADLRQAGFGGGGIEGGLGIHQADLTGADMTGMAIDGPLGASNLTNANLTDTVFSEASVGGNTYTGSTWTGSNLLPADQPPVQSSDGVGATVTYSLVDNTTDTIATGVTVTCVPPPGSRFLIGTTTVTCAVSDGGATTSGTGTFHVVVFGTTTIDGCTVIAAPTATTHTQCSGDDLTGIDLHGFDLSYADFSGATLTSANLNGATLTNANLTSATLTNTNLNGATLTNANLTGATLTNANLKSAILTNANVTNANLTGADLRTTINGAQLTGANFTQAKLGTFVNTILNLSDRTYAATSSSGRVTSWAAPAGLASVTGITMGKCNPPHSSLLHMGVTHVVCGLDVASPGTTGVIQFEVDIFPAVIPGNAIVAAPISGTSHLQVTVSLNVASPFDTTVPWYTLRVAGSPTLLGLPQAPITDYIPISGTVVIPAGQTTATIDIPVLADSASGDEFVVVSFHNPINALMGGFYGLGFGIITPAS
jgi:trimeric autotransporter adhesin